MKWKDKKKNTRQRIIKRNFFKRKGDTRRHNYRLLRRVQRVEIIVPKDFSLLNNTEETLKCLNSLIDNVSRQRSSINVNSSNVIFVDPSALMYLISILNDASSRHIVIRGTYPNDIKTKTLFIKYGFHRFVSHNKRKSCNYIDNDTLQIRESKTVSPDIAKSIVEFADSHNCFNKNKNLAKGLYASLIEMMANAYQHAYDCIKLNRWFISCEYSEGVVSFVLFDKGVGIPSTVQRKMKDKINSILSKQESIILKSALKGDFRTQTKEANRGKGLPQIYEFLKSDNVVSATLLSGHGYCEITNDNVKINVDLKNKLYGTLFSWSIKGVDSDE